MLTAYDGQTITYDAIGNPLNDGRRCYEWQAGRQLKKVYVKADLKEGTKAGVDEQTGTVLKIEWSNGNLLEGEVTSTQASAEVTRNGEDVTDEYAENAFHWTRDSGNIEADAVWNAAHAGMKTISLNEADLSGATGDVKLTCTLTASSASYGSISVDDDMDASHTPGELDVNDVFVIEDGYLKVTTSRGNVYALENGTLKATGAKLNGSITAETKLFASRPEDMVEFSYDHNGLRTQKKVTGADGTVETTDYMLHGKLLTHLCRGSDAMHFFYNNEKRPTMVEFDGALYSYIHSLQGDIVGILDSAGNLVVEYGYDAWGKPVVVRTLTTAYDVLAELNPFRYRGYVWDRTLEMYYALDRYYSSSCLKFINADDSDTVVAMQTELADKNLYAYCDNNPLIREDKEGNFWNFIVGGVIGAVVGAATQIVSNLTAGKEWSEGVGTAAVTGAASGVLAASGAGLVGSIAGNAAISMAGNAANQVIENDGFKNFDVEDMLLDGVAGGISGVIGGKGMGKAVNIRTLNRNLTKKLMNGSKETAKKAVKYYVSQTKSVYVKYLLRPIRNSAIFNAGYSAKKALDYRLG